MTTTAFRENQTKNRSQFWICQQTKIQLRSYTQFNRPAQLETNMCAQQNRSQHQLILIDHRSKNQITFLFAFVEREKKRTRTQYGFVSFLRRSFFSSTKYCRLLCSIYCLKCVGYCAKTAFEHIKCLFSSFVPFFSSTSILFRFRSFVVFASLSLGCFRSFSLSLLPLLWFSVSFSLSFSLPLPSTRSLALIFRYRFHLLPATL